MIFNIISVVLATILWAFAHFGMKNYEYHTSDNLKYAKMALFVLYIILSISIFF